MKTKWKSIERTAKCLKSQKVKKKQLIFDQNEDMFGSQKVEEGGEGVKTIDRCNANEGVASEWYTN